MAHLAPQPPVLVSFAGATSREGPLTLGQLNIVKWLSTIPAEQAERPSHAVLTWPVRLPAPSFPAARVADVTEAVAVLVVRHEGLRTLYLDGHRQRVAGSGEIPLQVFEVDSNGPADPAELVKELARWLSGRPYDAATQLPMWGAVAAAADQVLAAVLAYSHLAVDRHAMAVLGRELTELIADPACRQVGTPRHQPLDQAALEHGPAARRRAEDALRYWATGLRRMPPVLYPGPSNGSPAASMAMQLRSPAVAAALWHITARTRLTRPAAVLAAVCAVLSARSGYRWCAFAAIAGNRSGSPLNEYVGTVAMSSLIQVDTAAANYDELVGRAWFAVLRSGRHGLCDVYRLAEITREIERDRGVCFGNHEPTFNNAVVDSRQSTPPSQPLPLDELAAAAQGTRLEWRRIPPIPALVEFTLWRMDDVFVLDLRIGNTSRVGRDEAEAMLLAVERLLIAAAASNVDDAHIHELVALEPIAHGAGWLFIDSCWVELAEVQRLVETALAPARVRVFASVDDRPLVAYVTADGPVRSTMDAHARCLAGLAQQRAAMAPRHYILCEGAPDDPAELSGWQRRPVLCQGSGRA